jgi:hypothetical protein
MTVVYFGLWLGCAPGLYWFTGVMSDDVVTRFMILTWVWVIGLAWLMTYGMNVVIWPAPEVRGDYDDAVDRGMVLRFGDQIERKAQ